MKPTPSGKLNRLIAQAESGGLTVSVKPVDHEGGNVESYLVDFEMPDLGPVRTALDSYHKSRRIHVHALRWGIGSARPFRLHIVEWSVTGRRDIRPRVLPYAISGMVDDLARWRELRAERTEAGQ